MVSARKITDGMAIRAAHSIAEFAEKRGIDTENIMPNMLEWEVFPKVAADVAMQAIQEGVALHQLTWDEVYQQTKQDIMKVREITNLLQDQGFIPQLEEEQITRVMDRVIAKIKSEKC
jgi:malate dehydrogenase (oxaloacetate-decarboxylating)